MIQYIRSQDRRGTPLLPGSALLEGMAVDALVEVDGVTTSSNALRLPVALPCAGDNRDAISSMQKRTICEQECDQWWEWDYFDGNTHSL